MIDHSPSPSTSSRIQGFLSDWLSQVVDEHPNAAQACRSLASHLSEGWQAAKQDIIPYWTEYNPATSREKIRHNPWSIPSLDTQTAPCTSIADCGAQDERWRNRFLVGMSRDSTQVPQLPRNEGYLSHTKNTNTELSTPITDDQSFLGPKANPIPEPKTPDPSVAESCLECTSLVNPSQLAKMHQSVDSLFKLSPAKIDPEISANSSEISSLRQESGRRRRNRMGDVDAKLSDYPISPNALPDYGGKCDGLSLGGPPPDTGGGGGGGGGGGLDLGDLGGDCVIQ